MPTLHASLYLLHLVLKYISQFSYFNEKAEALLKDTIIVILKSASRVCTFEAQCEDFKVELTKYFFGIYKELKKWFLNKFGKYFGADAHIQWSSYTTEREIKVQLLHNNSVCIMFRYILKFLSRLWFSDIVLWHKQLTTLQIWNNILGIDIKCDQVLQMWQNDVVTKIIESRSEGVVCY